MTIDADLMDIAVSIEKDIPSRITGENRVFIRAVIARALSKARSQAFEEASKIAEAFGAPRTSRPPAGEFQGIRETVWEGMDELRRSQAQSISQAIRQHSQKGE